MRLQPGHDQGRASFDHHARRDVIDLAQLRFAGPGLRHDIGQAHGCGGFPHRPAGQFGVFAGFKLLQVLLEDFGVVPGQQDFLRGGGKDHRFFQRGVERFEIVHGHIGQLGGNLGIHVVLDFDHIKEGVVLDDGQLRAKGFGVGDDVFHRLQLGHVELGFCRHGQIGVARAQLGFFIALNGAADTAFAPVVGGQGQVPVAKHSVQFFQVIQRRAGGGQHIAPIVAQHVLLQVKVGAGGRHELPHASSLGAGDGLRVKRAFDVGQQRQLGGHVALFQLFDNVEQVFFGALGHAQDVVRAAAVPLLAIGDFVAFQVGHGKAAADAFPQVLGRLQRGDLARGEARLR